MNIKLLTLVFVFLLYGINTNAQQNKLNNMDRTSRCKATFEKLFHGEALTKTGNDPELMDILQKNIFGEIFYIGELSDAERELLTVTALATMQTLPQLKSHIHASLNIGVKPLEIREAIYQVAPFIGFPKTLNAIAIANEVFKERDIALPLENSSTTIEDERHQKGRAIQEPLYGNEINNNLEGLPNNLQQTISNLLTEMCFGDFYTRKGLSLQQRELIVLTILVTEGIEHQIQSHIIGNLKAGNHKDLLYATMIHLIPYIGFPKALNAIYLIKNMDSQHEVLFGQGEPNVAYNKYFVGQSYLKPMVTPTQENPMQISNVTFSPACRNNWHTHSVEQILLVTDGEGWYQEEGKEAKPLHKGDIVVIKPKVKHWHGATADSWFTHIAIMTDAISGTTDWCLPVLDKDYILLKNKK